MKKNQWIGENEWTSMTYLRKSLLEDPPVPVESLNQEREGSPLAETSASNILKEETYRYYEYSIYDYCAIPEEMAIQIVVSSGYSSAKLEQNKTSVSFART